VKSMLRSRAAARPGPVPGSCGSDRGARGTSGAGDAGPPRIRGPRVALDRDSSRRLPAGRQRIHQPFDGAELPRIRTFVESHWAPSRSPFLTLRTHRPDHQGRSRCRDR